MSFNPYTILNVPTNASDMDIKKAYRRLARKYHPDVSVEPDAEERFKEIQKAYDILSDPELRTHYDATGNSDEEGLDPVRDILTYIMRQVMIAVVTFDDRNLNILATANHTLDDSERRARQQIEDLTDTIKKVKRLRGRVRRKGGVKAQKKTNLFEIMLDNELRNLTDMVEVKLPKAIKNLSDARKALNDYESGEGFEIESAVRRLAREF